MKCEVERGALKIVDVYGRKCCAKTVLIVFLPFSKT
jgi:hypothetical protein